MPKKPSVSAIPVNTPSTEASSDEPASESQTRDEVLNEIKAEPQVEVTQKKARLKRSKTVEEPDTKSDVVEEKSEEVKKPEKEQVACERCGKRVSAKT